jgi:hypothetical protein
VSLRKEVEFRKLWSKVLSMAQKSEEKNFEADRRKTPRPDSPDRRKQMRPTPRLKIIGFTAALILMAFIYLAFRFF